MPVTEFYLIIPLAAGAFFATNMDNFVLLAAMLARDSRQKGPVLLGYAASALIVLGLSFVIAKSADLLPIEYLGLLGVVPLAMGARGLIDLVRHRNKREPQTEFSSATRRSVPYQTALILISNSGDPDPFDPCRSWGLYPGKHGDRPRARLKL